MQLEIELTTSSSRSHGSGGQTTTRLTGLLRTNTSTVVLVFRLARWRRHTSKQQLARLKRDLDEVENAVSALRRARLRQLAVARHQRAES